MSRRDAPLAKSSRMNATLIRSAYTHERFRAADLAYRRARLTHAVEYLEQMPVRTLVFVDRHGTPKASSRLHQLRVGASLSPSR